MQAVVCNNDIVHTDTADILCSLILCLPPWFQSTERKLISVTLQFVEGNKNWTLITLGAEA